MPPDLTIAPPAWVAPVRATAQAIRRRVLDHTLRNDGGYMSQACSAAELLATLYLRTMRIGPPPSLPLVPGPFPGVPAPGNDAYQTGARFNGPGGALDDRFFLSPAHYALVVYAALVETGRMDEEGLRQFNRDGGSVEMIGAEHSPGMEVTAGSLGQCIAQAAGIAWARRRRGDRGRTWVMLSDGEFQIGQTWEAIQAIAHQGLDQLRVVADCNGQQCDGTIASVMATEPIDERLKAFGWSAVRVDGHDPVAIAEAAEAPSCGRPLAVLCDTDPCRGLDALRARAPRLHYLRFATPAERAPFAAALEAL